MSLGTAWSALSPFGPNLSPSSKKELVAMRDCVVRLVGQVTTENWPIDVGHNLNGVAAMGNSRPSILLVHGAWMQSWTWATVTTMLTESGWDVRTVDLPTTAAEGASNFALYDDAAVVRRAIGDIDRPVVVVGHSYGGAVVSEGAAGQANVARLVYVCAFQLDTGESLLDVTGDQPPPWWLIDGDVMTVDNPQHLFFNDLNADEADRAAARLLPFSLKAVTQPLTDAAWRDVPSTYIVCDNDVAFGDGQDVFAQRATDVRRLPSGHSPFLSVPAELTTLIVEAASAESG
ncbi:alpha/beta fold hydrolase [Mycobacterium sp. ACS1612]|uniref:alpha/beta fold hydrolase n=1 Tax=Mycobacterium sp. ACS1612 TaxID=1834117 RepID=UPI0018D3EA1F|nr:alpha/beta hydrolase [Mycobacterium sp. ACS1612]